MCLLLVIICWHIGMKCRVKWEGAFSDKFYVPLGTKQGGISSPIFFSIYINDLIIHLRKLGLGCHIIHKSIASILFADNLVLLAPMRGALQRMINATQLFCQNHSLQFNVKKSKILVFGNSYKDANLKPFTICDIDIDYVMEWKNLGVTLVSGKRVGFSARPDLMTFFRATNSILNALQGAQEHVLLTLLYTNCVPILTYACAVKEFSNSEMSDCNVAMNNACRKIFGFRH